ncbi:ATP-dependent DNA helicase RecG [Exiguobacterium aurantiacum]|uniref:ATP-dependent DNA helicase RecG n=1 Tax=Exiguobacterium aurantiacum TaxID=33987 RepID=A0A377FUJ8_9BACL|nr:ATP-dependent DNA helicase RecG [Exiguobacterium aurantiacum]STO08502.1 ATP-dependent DNA helicase recG [Exiguobacterium aurantiacum]
MLKSESLTTLKGVGPEMAKKLEAMGLERIEDVLEHVPFRYENYNSGTVTTAVHGDLVKWSGTVQAEPLVRYYSKGKNRLQFRLLLEERYVVHVTMFNRAFYKDKLTLGSTVTVKGKWDMNRMTISATDLEFGELSDGLQPIYSLRSGLTQKNFSRIVKLAFDQTPTFDDRLPESIRERYRLQDRASMLKGMHFPESVDAYKQARRSYVYEECLLYQLKLQAFRKMERSGKGRALSLDKQQLNEFVKRLAFPLTGAQTRVIREIVDDLEKPERMNRLLQGDVGSGKTVVAAIALYATVRAGYQGALMVPTEILAEQHVTSLQALFEPYGMRVALLTSSVKGKARTELLAAIKAGDVDIIVGTHALIQGPVEFSSLHLAITDEQHRFGVEQRKMLRDKADLADVLYMTATPIPRTLAISAFGEMDVSTIDEMPAGRKPIETYWAKPDQIDRVHAMVERELALGRQAYVIAPLIEESDTLEVENATALYELLNERFRQYAVGLMHGKLSSAEKDEVMKSFSENALQILVSTTVVEVGVNVPNASLIIIHDAERFGLAQLHQLRGRVGRGAHQSYCLLVGDPKSDVGKLRLKTMTETNDGFVLAEKDLELRGAGDFFGTAQSGLPSFRVADPVLDLKVMEVAMQDAVRLLGSETFWHDEAYAPLRHYLKRLDLLVGERLE